jgi:hypothetical protein
VDAGPVGSGPNRDNRDQLESTMATPDDLVQTVIHQDHKENAKCKKN